MFNQAKRPERAPGLFDAKGLKVFDCCRKAREPFRNIVGALIPHIHQPWGLESYLRITAALLNSPRPDVVYMFGFNHLAYGTPHNFHATRSAYLVGNSEIQLCEETLLRLEQVVGRENFYHEKLHKEEWTIEYALPPLLYAYGSSWKMVPIILEHRPKMFDDGLEGTAMLHAVVDSVQEHIRKNRRVLLVSAVDLSHHGAFFHDDHSTSHSRKQIEKRDGEYLEQVFRMDAVGAEMFLGENPTRNEAIAAMSLVGRVANITKLAHSGELLHFGHFFDRKDDRFVTIASGVLVGSS